MNITPRQRDRHLHRVSRITRWLVVAAAGATGLFTFLLARPQPSAAKATANASGSAANKSTATTAGSAGSSGAKSSGKTSSAPKAAPAPKRTTRAPQASSGGS